MGQLANANMRLTGQGKCEACAVPGPGTNTGTAAPTRCSTCILVFGRLSFFEACSLSSGQPRSKDVAPQDVPSHLTEIPQYFPRMGVPQVCPEAILVLTSTSLLPPVNRVEVLYPLTSF